VKLGDEGQRVNNNQDMGERKKGMELKTLVTSESKLGSKPGGEALRGKYS